MIRTLTLAGAALIALAVPAVGQTTAALVQNRPVLKAEAVVTGDIVRIGDLVAHAGIVANRPIFRAPDLGSTGTVSVEAVIEAVRAHALIGLDTGGVNEVVVTRASRTIPAKDIEDGFFERLVASPVARTSILVGRVAGVALLVRQGRLAVPLDHVHARHDHLIVLGQHLPHRARAAPVFALHDKHCVFSLDLLHVSYTTSGASDTIFMNLRSRSSRATGPKMRVPRGFSVSASTTAAFSSKRM